MEMTHIGPPLANSTKAPGKRSLTLKNRKDYLKIIFFLIATKDLCFNPIKDGPFQGCSWWGEAKRPPSLKSVTHILQ